MMSGLVWVLRLAVEKRVIIERDVGFRDEGIHEVY